MDSSTAWINDALAHPLAWATARAQTLDSRDWLVLAGILVFQRLCVHIGMWSYCLAVLPGTALHEAMHWVVAALLGARPTMPNLVPVRTPMGWRLGSVRFQAGYFRSLPIALAPVALAPLSFWWATTFMPGAGSGAVYSLHAWLAASAFGASVPSTQDWSVAAPALLVGAVVAVTLWGVFGSSGLPACQSLIALFKGCRYDARHIEPAAAMKAAISRLPRCPGPQKFGLDDARNHDRPGAAAGLHPRRQTCPRFLTGSSGTGGPWWTPKGLTFPSPL